jgi:hypothetical protein
MSARARPDHRYRPFVTTAAPGGSSSVAKPDIAQYNPQASGEPGEIRRVPNAMTSNDRRDRIVTGNGDRSYRAVGQRPSGRALGPVAPHRA